MVDGRVKYVYILLLFLSLGVDARKRRRKQTKKEPPDQIHMIWSPKHGGGAGTLGLTDRSSTFAKQLSKNSDKSSIAKVLSKTADRHKAKATSVRSRKGTGTKVADVCLPEGTDRLLYRYENATNIYIGFHHLESGMVYSMTWEYKPGSKNELLAKRTDSGYKQEPIGLITHALSRRNILAAANARQQLVFQKNVEVCENGLMNKSCLIEVFAKTARRMKPVDTKKLCSKKT